MNIAEAIKATTDEMPFITRKAWLVQTSRYGEHGIKIQATDTPDCCIISTLCAKNPCRGWQPQAGDLVADDWVVCK